MENTVNNIIPGSGVHLIQDEVKVANTAPSQAAESLPFRTNSAVDRVERIAHIAALLHPSNWMGSWIVKCA